jgi:hypothetical protein
VSFRCIDGTSGNQHYRGRAVYSADESVLSQSNIVLVENAVSQGAGNWVCPPLSGSVMHRATMHDELEQLAALLDSHVAGAAVRLRRMSRLQARGEDRFWAEINVNEIWGEAGSLADQAFVVNSGLPPDVWQARRRNFTSS